MAGSAGKGVYQLELNPHKGKRRELTPQICCPVTPRVLLHAHTYSKNTYIHTHIHTIHTYTHTFKKKPA